MSVVLVSAALVTCVAAAVRSTWSPCGWSMLSTITPLTERGRGHRFGATAAWFVGGALAGGALLGAGSAGLAFVVRTADVPMSARVAIGAGAAFIAAGWDAGMVRPELPHHRRQVNEEWLDEFRPWVYATGFGFQIGTGLATYIMSAGVYLVVALGALTGEPFAAVGIALAFGGIRGLAILVGVRNTEPAPLARFHRRFAEVERSVRHAVTACLTAVGVGLGLAAAGAPTGFAASVPVGAAVAALVIVLVVNATDQRSEISIPASAPLSAPTSVERRATEPTTA